MGTSLFIIFFVLYFQVLSHFIDCVFDGSEKDEVISLLKSVMYNAWPHLHNHRFVSFSFLGYSQELK